VKATYEQPEHSPVHSTSPTVPAKAGGNRSAVQVADNSLVGVACAALWRALYSGELSGTGGWVEEGKWCVTEYAFGERRWSRTLVLVAVAFWAGCAGDTVRSSFSSSSSHTGLIRNDDWQFASEVSRGFLVVSSPFSPFFPHFSFLSEAVGSSSPTLISDPFPLLLSHSSASSPPPLPSSSPPSPPPLAAQTAASLPGALSCPSLVVSSSVSSPSSHSSRKVNGRLAVRDGDGQWSWSRWERRRDSEEVWCVEFSPSSFDVFSSLSSSLSLSSLL
jgi:hypothetical protein